MQQRKDYHDSPLLFFLFLVNEHSQINCYNFLLSCHNFLKKVTNSFSKYISKFYVSKISIFFFSNARPINWVLSRILARLGEGWGFYRRITSYYRYIFFLPTFTDEIISQRFLRGVGSDWAIFQGKSWAVIVIQRALKRKPEVNLFLAICNLQFSNLQINFNVYAA